MHIDNKENQQTNRKNEKQNKETKLICKKHGKEY